MPPTDQAIDLLRFIDAAPSPYHAVAEVSRRLDAAGFRRLDEADAWEPGAGAHYVVRGGSVVAWVLDAGSRVPDGFRIVGAHTDSPNLRIKPRPDTGAAGFRQLGVEVYGGPLLNSWLDRDLGLSGRVALRGDGTHPVVELVRVDRPLLRIPQLAIHLDRGVNENGLQLNPQAHLAPIWGLGAVRDGAFVELLAAELGVRAAEVVSWEIMVHDLTASTLAGADDEFVSAPRLDNLASCHAAVSALTSRHLAAGAASPDRTPGAPTAGVIPVVCLFDHEEIGSQSASGADSSLLPTLLERIATAAGADRSGFHQGLAASVCLSADGAHATHPNYAERHEPNHAIRLNGGPVLKVNSNVRYASDAVSSAWLQLAADRAGVELQRFVSRTDLPCGSTIGPVTASRLGIPTVDVGLAQLAMHSARELGGSADPESFLRLLRTFLTS